jgi:hypothetical protein
VRLKNTPSLAIGSLDVSVAFYRFHVRGRRPPCRAPAPQRLTLNFEVLKLDQINMLPFDCKSVCPRFEPGLISRRGDAVLIVPCQQGPEIGFGIFDDAPCATNTYAHGLALSRRFALDIG